MRTNMAGGAGKAYGAGGSGNGVRCTHGSGEGHSSLTLSVSVPRGEGGDVAIVRLYGELDVRTAGDLRGTLLGLAREHDVVVADFSGVEFCDAAGLGVLVAA